MTPAMLYALAECQFEAHRRYMMGAGTVAAAVYNAAPFRDRTAKLVDPMDFVPKKHQAKQREQTLEEQIAVLSAVMGCGPDKPGEAGA
jgi:hypothetical protein